MRINIKNTEINLKYSFRSLMLYENITGKTLEPKGVIDIITYFYCVIISSTKDIDLSFEEFIDWVDEHPTMVVQFGSWLIQTAKNNNALKKD